MELPLPAEADPALRGTWRSAFPARPGDLLNLRDLEQGLEQMKRVPSQEVAIAITPGAQPGESEVVLTLKRGHPLRLTGSGDAAGLQATGRYQGGLYAAWDNPLGCSDLFNASLSHDLTEYQRRSGTRGLGLGYSVPWGYWTFSTSWNQQASVQRLTGLSQELAASGISRNTDLRISYLFYRNQEAALTKRWVGATGPAVLQVVDSMPKPE